MLKKNSPPTHTHPKKPPKTVSLFSVSLTHLQPHSRSVPLSHSLSRPSAGRVLLPSFLPAPPRRRAVLRVFAPFLSLPDSSSDTGSACREHEPQTGARSSRPGNREAAERLDGKTYQNEPKIWTRILNKSRSAFLILSPLASHRKERKKEKIMFLAWKLASLCEV